MSASVEGHGVFYYVADVCAEIEAHFEKSLLPNKGSYFLCFSLLSLIVHAFGLLSLMSISRNINGLSLDLASSLASQTTNRISKHTHVHSRTRQKTKPTMNNGREQMRRHECR